MTLKKELFEIYYKDTTPHGLYNTLKLIGVTEKSGVAKKFLAEYKI